MAEETPPHVDTTSDRIFAAPRTDIIIGKELPPKTIETERLAENAIAAAYGALAASAMLSVNESVAGKPPRVGGMKLT